MNAYVNKQTIIRKLNKFAIDCLKEDQLERYTAYCTAACNIAMTKGADVQPVKRGHWEEIEDYDGNIHYRCTNCKTEFYLEAGSPVDNEYFYCPHCGADMIEKEGAEDNER